MDPQETSHPVYRPSFEFRRITPGEYGYVRIRAERRDIERHDIRVGRYIVGQHQDRCLAAAREVLGHAVNELRVCTIKIVQVSLHLRRV